MRILAIRGRNLTALSGDFVVDFEADPLSAAGLFAITGPTGAGKSTLLDALCVALYDKFPRLENAARVAVGQPGTDDSLLVTGTDPRTILRHGEGSGFAEVDFAGRDGGRYRARWEVRRARNKPGGKLQAQAMSLRCLDSDRELGGTKTETLAVIAQKTGLTFDQFRRSVLLAQGDFDAFLKARPADRADLLELMTGTAIYGELSEAAYGRWKAEKEALDALDAQRQALALLTPEDREAAEAAAEAAEAEARAATETLEGLRAQAAWHKETARLTQGVAAAEAEAARAEESRTAATGDRERGARLKRLHRLRPVVAEADRLAGEETRLTQDRAQAEAHRDKATADMAAAAENNAKARAALDRAEQAQEAAGPDLDRAADLDSKLEAAAEHRDRCRATRSDAEARATQAEEALAAQKQARDQAAARVADSEAWLADNAGRRVLAEQVDRWADLLEDWAEAATARDTARARVEALTGRLTDLEARKAKRTDIRDTAAAGLAAAEADLKPLQDQLAALDPEALEERRARAAAAEAATADLVRLARHAGEQAERRKILTTRRSEAEARINEAGRVLEQVTREREPLDERLSDARRTLELSEAANDEAAARLRSLLVDGEPCPVCGGLDHSRAHGDTALDRLVRDRREQVAALTEQMKALDAQERRALADKDSGQEALTACTEEARRLAREAEALREAWDEARRKVPDAPDAAAPEAADLAALSARAEAAATAAREAAEAQKQAARLQADADRKRARCDDLRLQLDQARDTLATIERAHAQADAERTAAETEARRAAKVLEDADAALDGPLAVLPQWRDDARADAAALIARCRSLAAGWRDKQAALEEGRAAVAKADAAIGAAEAEARGCRDSANAARREQENADAAHARLAEARAALFGGEATSAVRSRLNAARLEAQGALTAAQASQAEAASAQAAATSAVDSVTQRLTDTAKARAEADAARDRALAEADATLEEARAALAVTEDALAAMDARLQALDEAVTHARAVLSDRRKALDAHRETPAPEADEEALALRLAEVEETCEAARQRAAAERARLAHDQAQREKGAEIEAAMTRQRQVTDLWASMNDLIGSANGDKFRRFAQSLTLDRLLGLANAHLSDLAPRYALQRAPGGELDLQVIDREMGDEVRGVGSLSGGERFLVSLALALGLASMSGERTLVESLFIDEGFGALDATSLDVAISALEALQATGRKVGVISHVQAMVDRIGVQVRVTKAGGGRSVVEVAVA